MPLPGFARYIPSTWNVLYFSYENPTHLLKFTKRTFHSEKSSWVLSLERIAPTALWAEKGGAALLSVQERLEVAKDRLQRDGGVFGRRERVP